MTKQKPNIDQRWQVLFTDDTPPPIDPAVARRVRGVSEAAFLATHDQHGANKVELCARVQPGGRSWPALVLTSAASLVLGFFARDSMEHSRRPVPVEVVDAVSQPLSSGTHALSRSSLRIAMCQSEMALDRLLDRSSAEARDAESTWRAGQWINANTETEVNDDSRP